MRIKRSNAPAHLKLKIARTILDLAGSTEIQFPLQAEALRPWSPDILDVMNVFFQNDICLINEQTLIQSYCFLT